MESRALCRTGQEETNHAQQVISSDRRGGQGSSFGKANHRGLSSVQDDTCWFAALDFDKRTWEADARAFLETQPTKQKVARSSRAGRTLALNSTFFFSLSDRL
jgi:hypothetical protein